MDGQFLMYNLYIDMVIVIIISVCFKTKKKDYPSATNSPLSPPAIEGESVTKYTENIIEADATNNTLFIILSNYE